MGCVKSLLRRSSTNTYNVEEGNTNKAVEDDELVYPGRSLFEESLVRTYRENVLNDEDLRRSRGVRDDLEQELKLSAEAVLEFVVELVGSCRSGVGARHADVDITLIPFWDARSQVQLDSVAWFLKNQSDFDLGSFRFVTFLSRARVPIIKLKHKASGSDVDISWNRPENVLMARLLDIYAEINPFVHPLIVLLKLWMKMRNLLDAPAGYLGGFQLSLMVIYHQQECNGMPALEVPEFPTRETLEEVASTTERMNCIVNEATLVAQLRDFFHYFNDFDYFTVIDVRGRADKATKMSLSDDTGQWWTPVAMLNPITGPAGGNHGACVRLDQMHDIRNAFRDAALMLE